MRVKFLIVHSIIKMRLQLQSLICAYFLAIIGHSSTRQFNASIHNSPHGQNNSSVNLSSPAVISTIIGGVNSIDRPFYIRIVNTGNYEFCGGSIVNSFWIITAASCVYEYTGKFQFFFTV